VAPWLSCVSVYPKILVVLLYWPFCRSYKRSHAHPGCPASWLPCRPGCPVILTILSSKPVCHPDRPANPGCPLILAVLPS
jgi:hypothetical protein